MKKNFFLMLILAIFFAIAQSQPVYDTIAERMVFQTNKDINSTIELAIDADVASQGNVWIDLNNDGVCQSGEKVNIFGEIVSYTLASQKVTIYGKINLFVCSDNEITKLDVSQNPELSTFNCCTNLLQNINLSANTNLKILACESNQIDTLDLMANNKLEEVMCWNNKIKHLSLPANDSSLVYLDCATNLLDNINVSQSLNLKEFACTGNQLSDIDLSANKELTMLFCQGNHFSSLNITHNPKLCVLYCLHNEISGENMQALVESLPTLGEPPSDAPTYWSEFYVVVIGDSQEMNECTNAQVKIAKSKNWKVKAWDHINFSEVDYEGSDVSTPNDISHNIQFFTSQGKLKIVGVPVTTHMQVFSIDGKLVYSSFIRDSAHEINLQPNIYIVRIGGDSFKIVIP